jgi:hypothetical protein
MSCITRRYVNPYHMLVREEQDSGVRNVSRTCASENKHEIKVKHYEMDLRKNVQATFE